MADFSINNNIKADQQTLFSNGSLCMNQHPVMESSSLGSRQSGDGFLMSQLVSRLLVNVSVSRPLCLGLGLVWDLSASSQSPLVSARSRDPPFSVS